MKKILVALLCISMLVAYMGLPVYADEQPSFVVAKAFSPEGSVDVPVYITDIPGTYENITSIDFKYSYDTNVLQYIGTTKGATDSGAFVASDGAVNWIDDGDVFLSAKITRDNIGAENPLFVLNFTIKDNSGVQTPIVIENLKLSTSKATSADSVVIYSGLEKKYSQISGMVVFKDKGSSDDTTGDDTTGDDTTGGDNTGDDTTGDDTTGGDNTGDDTTGGDNTGSDNTGDNTTGGDNTGDNTTDDNTSGGNSSSGDDGSGPIKPNNNTSSKPSGGSSRPSGGASVSVPTTPVVTETPAAPSKASEVFSDVSDDHWAAKYALVLYNEKIISGDSNKRANLDNLITREETSKLALLVNGISADVSAQLDAADASKVSDWAKSFMATAIKEGIFSGYEDGTIRPLNQITREEMVTVIIKSLKLDVADVSDVAFADASKITWSAPYVAKAVELGFVNGYEDNSFRPENPITRAEAFTIFARVLEYKNK